MTDRDSEFGAFLAGFIIGGLVGAAVSLLLAPQSGEETRGLIREKSIELKDKATETAEQARERATVVASEAKTKADALAHQAKERADELKKRGQEIFVEQKTKIESKLPRKTQSAADESIEVPSE